MTQDALGQAAAEPDSSSDYNLVIYQNSTFVAALLQQLLNIGLPMEDENEQANARAQAQSTDGTASGGTGVHVNLPMFPVKAGVNLKGDLTATASANDSYENRSRVSRRFTQANYLHTVKKELEQRSLIRDVHDVESMTRLQTGDFVRFKSFFKPNDLSTFIELVTPEMVAAFLRNKHKQEAIKKFDWTKGHDERVAFAQRLELEVEPKIEMAVATTKAIKQAFRNDATREFIGTLGPIDDRRITALTICDTEHFIGLDRDRILDGHFTVLGKLTSTSYGTESVLSNNKVLRRVQPAALDLLTESFKDQRISSMFDMSISLKLNPPIMTVIPIAIYV